MADALKAGPRAWATSGARSVAARSHAVQGEAGAVTGGPRSLLRLEGAVILLAAAVAYTQFGAGWGLFAALFLVPDLALLAYFAGPRQGAATYNAMHSTIGPAALIALGAMGDTPLALAIGLIWLAHVGLDRALGFGLKYDKGFSYTHLGPVGPVDPW
ncbi:DUF4260 domain-containing protein [Variovorax sp. J22R133]|uniref:DUF4260 domain-containing protein n=1 Tax=Variovorax brevis TaxID=3053503 RepID=UPI002578A603|nr:DUF4260 domain-containing protein [Variovorax sp. J22R133]MDM0115615.1 DUF4260 domain-containing protein [Variovorax sp. J22R133]